MQPIINHTAAILSELSGTIQHLPVSDHIYPRDTTTPAYIASLGIRSLAKNDPLDGSAYVFQYATVSDRQNTSNLKWHSFKKDAIIDDLQNFFINCQIISFADWSAINGASDLWDGLLRDVIRPLRKKDFEYIFYLGDPAKKSVSEVDEFLDIISDFSLHGRVTFALDEDEASRLWMMLNGYDPDKPLPALLLPSPEERQLFIFNSMNIHYLLIYSADHTLFYSAQGQCELVDKAHNNTSIEKHARNNFNAGFSLGLQHQLDISQCAALGLAVSGSYRENGIPPERNTLILYIKKWMSELGAL